jgi:hypothetical protein
VLERFGIEHAGFDINALCRVMGIEVREGGLEHADAWLIRRKDGRGILRLNTTVSSDARRRFSIAHELGHWEMHPNLTQGRYCTEANLADYHRSPEEIEANMFAATLLMPKFLMRDYMGGGDPSFAQIDHITQEFETSRTATARRFVELTKHQLILVCSTDGRINWRVKSSAALYYALADRAVPAESATAKALASGDFPQELTAVAARVWLKNNPVSNPQELFEDVRYFPRLNIALTLLWFV